MFHCRLLPGVLALSLLTAFLHSSAAAPVDRALYQSLRWRMIGPFRGGRTVGASGMPGKPNVFYIGVNNGGVWKTTDFGRVWTPRRSRADHQGAASP